MTPFIVWLKKNEIDELITIMVRASKDTNLNSEVFSTDELINLTENLLEQNNTLIEILKKITPVKDYKNTIQETISATQQQQTLLDELKLYNNEK